MAISEGLLAKGINMTPYTVARIADDPRSAGKSLRLRRLIERGVRDSWTIKKVAAMSTEAIEEQLGAFGVDHSRERFMALAEGRSSAWTISDAWLGHDPVNCKGKDKDFLGLAACELWKRLVPDRPSTEMLDDLMQEGYSLVEQDREAEACDLWWKVWCTLLPRFAPEMCEMEDVEEVFNGVQSVFNWSQDFEMHLRNASRDDVRYASIGRQYCTEWIAQFTKEGDGTQVNFRRALASFLFRLGEVDEMSAVLHRLPEEWPKDVWCYVALADAYSHFFSGEYDLPLDLDKAMRYLERGLAVAGLNQRDRDIVEERAAELRKRSPGAPAPR